MAAAQVGALTYETIMMNYHHRFRVQASLARVAEFHSHAASMAAITPPPIVVKVQRAPAVLADGDEMAFTMWLGLPVLFAFRVWKTKRMLS